MMYFAVFLVLFVLELIYFKIADRFNIIDKPNHRSSHTEITLRGGGIIFPTAFLLYFASSILYRKDTFLPKEYWAFGLGLHGPNGDSDTRYIVFTNSENLE